MSRSLSRPTLRQLRQVYLLVGECRRLGSDPVAWRRRMLEGIHALCGAAVTFGGEAAPPAGPDQPWRQRMVDVGWTDPSFREKHQRWISENRQIDDPFTAALFAQRGPLPVCRRRQIVDDDIWHGSELFALLQQIQLDDALGSCFVDQRGHRHIIGMYRALEAAPFGERERLLLWLLQREVRGLAGDPLASFDQPSVADVTPRARQTLLCLLEGCSEGETADRLGVTSHTVHQYTKQLYRHYGVCSRGELLARCAGLRPVLVNFDLDWRSVLTAVPAGNLPLCPNDANGGSRAQRSRRVNVADGRRRDWRRSLRATG